MQVPVYNISGEVTKQIEISDEVFAVPINQAVVHQAMVRQQANARQGTSSTKTRGDVAGSGKKLFRQKHTGFARAGDKRSPLRRGGGVAFGPQPRDYSQAMPKKMRQLALRCMLSAKAGDGELMVVEGLNFEQPKTKEIAQILKKLGINSPAIIVTPEPEDNLIKSSRNLASIKTMPTNLLNVGDLLSYKILLMTEAAVHRAEELWGEKSMPKGEASAST
jgi:large subunit ribosomal protein L4